MRGPCTRPFLATLPYARAIRLVAVAAEELRSAVDAGKGASTLTRALALTLALATPEDFPPALQPRYLLALSQLQALAQRAQESSVAPSPEEVGPLAQALEQLWQGLLDGGLRAQP